MKKLFLFHFLFISLFAYEDVDNKTAFDVLMFKSGVMSLTKDFENEKENIASNTKEIETLKQEVQYLLQENMKLKLGVQDTNLQNENNKLKEQILNLKNRLNKTIVLEGFNKKEIHELNNIKKTIVRIGHPNGMSLNMPNDIIGKPVFKYDRNSSLELDYCDQYDWCKIAGKNEYIPKYKLIFATRTSN